MTQTTPSEIHDAGRREDADRSTDSIEGQRRAMLRDRHAQVLTRLMAERDDLRGVHTLADFIDDSVRWTA